MDPVIALVIPYDGTPLVKAIEPDLRAITAVLGCQYIEAIQVEMPGPGTWHAYVDEEGSFNGALPNPNATQILTALGAQVPLIRGNAIIFGSAYDPEDGWALEGDVPDEVIVQAQAALAVSIEDQR